MVLLLHSSENAPPHFDWLLAPSSILAGDDDPSLLGFRVGDRIDALGPAATFHAEPMPAHRAIYLRYEGPLSRHRGRVQRVAAGSWEPRLIADHAISGVLDWGYGRSAFIGAPDRAAGGMWRFEIAAHTDR